MDTDAVCFIPKADSGAKRGFGAVLVDKDEASVFPDDADSVKPCEEVVQDRATPEKQISDIGGVIAVDQQRGDFARRAIPRAIGVVVCAGTGTRRNCQGHDAADFLPMRKLNFGAAIR